MVSMDTEATGYHVETGPFAIATLLIGAGMLMAFAGFIVACFHALSQSSQLINQLETPPNEMAKSKMNQMMAAATAGANAWKEFVPNGGAVVH